ncbi:peptidase, partial [Burkholderia cenocepacia]
ENPYFTMIRGTWGKRLRQVFAEIDDPDWETGTSPSHPLRREGHSSAEVEPVRVAPPAADVPATPDRAPGPALEQVSTIQRVAGGSQKSH